MKSQIAMGSNSVDSTEFEKIVRDAIKKTPVYLPPWYDWEDILQEARYAGLVAMDNYLPHLGCKLTTLIFCYVDQHLLNLQQRLTGSLKRKVIKEIEISKDETEIEITYEPYEVQPNLDYDGEAELTWNWPDYNLFPLDKWCYYHREIMEAIPDWTRQVLRLLLADPRLEMPEISELTGLSLYKIREAISFIRGAIKKS